MRRISQRRFLLVFQSLPKMLMAPMTNLSIAASTMPIMLSTHALVMIMMMMNGRHDGDGNVDDDGVGRCDSPSLQWAPLINFKTIALVT